ncbi:MAG TPA: [FeFe] hydrogenase H-cluster radical SAM maturase HydG [Terracidiphilus sp.]|nr:[FeFe] hydrogenase H-cluster radical SAM maturase HydG [Terracidiphilus sp.]
MITEERADFINHEEVESLLTKRSRPAPSKVRELLAKARELHGLSMEEVACLTQVENPDLLAEISSTARKIKEEIYGSRLVFFAPLYISNRCANECTYCAFRATNTELTRRTLTQEEIAEETRILIRQGHKRVLVVAGEALPPRGFQYITDTISTIYDTRVGPGEIRRVNVNLAPQSVERFKLLKDAGIGTFQLFQETYHRPTYASVHLKGKKRDYDWRATAFDRAMEAGIDDVGMGLLFGLYDWRFEVLSLMQHIRHLEETFGVGPHTISFPRMEPAVGSDIASRPPHVVSDADFIKLIAIMRLAVPYTGMIMSTRETAEVRRQTFAVGISQISAGSRTDPGGYKDGEGDPNGSQFQLGDHRSVEEVVTDVVSLGYTPSFCTACYRLGRTGQDFMDLAKPGEIKYHCQPNALSTFLEYLCDYAGPVAKSAGEKLISIELQQMDNHQTACTLPMLNQVRRGERDVFV